MTWRDLRRRYLFGQPLGCEALDRLVQRWHQQPTLTCQGRIGRPARAPAQLQGRRSHDRRGIKPGRDSQLQGQFMPGQRRAIGQMPDPGFTIEQEVKRYPAKVRHIGWRDAAITRRRKGLTRCKISHGLHRKVVAIIWRKECGRPDHEVIAGQACQSQLQSGL